APERRRSREEDRTQRKGGKKVKSIRTTPVLLVALLSACAMDKGEAPTFGQGPTSTGKPTNTNQPDTPTATRRDDPLSQIQTMEAASSDAAEKKLLQQIYENDQQLTDDEIASSVNPLAATNDLHSVTGSVAVFTKVMADSVSGHSNSGALMLGDGVTS